MAPEKGISLRAAASAAPPRRILHVLGSLGAGGVETWLYRTSLGLDRERWSPEFCLLSENEGVYAPELRAAGCRFHRCPFSPRESFPARFLDLLRRERFDLVHSHVFHFSGAVTALAAAAGVPVRIAHAHNTSDGRDDSAPRRAYRALMRRLTAHFATARLGCSAGALRALFGLQAASTGTILHYGVNLDAFEQAGGDGAGRAGLLAEFPLPAEARVVGHVGRLDRQKNQFFLLQVFNEYLKLESRAFLVLVGDGPLRRELQSEVSRLGLADRVVFAGVRRDVPRLMVELFDLFLLPSRWEGLPGALLEAQAAGLASLVSDRISAETFAIGELIRVESLNVAPARWAEALVEESESGRIAVAEACRRMRAAGFDAAESGRRLTAIYDQLLGRALRREAA